MALLFRHKIAYHKNFATSVVFSSASIDFSKRWMNCIGVTQHISNFKTWIQFLYKNCITYWHNYDNSLNKGTFLKILYFVQMCISHRKFSKLDLFSFCINSESRIFTLRQTNFRFVPNRTRELWKYWVKQNISNSSKTRGMSHLYHKMFHAKNLLPRVSFIGNIYKFADFWSPYFFKLTEL